MGLRAAFSAMSVSYRQCCFRSTTQDDSANIERAASSPEKRQSSNLLSQQAPQLYDISSSGLNSTIVSIITLEVIESTTFVAGDTIELSSNGITQSRSPVTEALASHCTVVDTETSVRMEFRLPEEEIGEQCFAIIFHKQACRFSLTDLGRGTGTFVKITEPLLLKPRYIISFGDSHMAVNVKPRDDQADPISPTLRVMFVDGPKLDQTFSFEPSVAIVRIGRVAECDIRFAETNLSRIQLVIKYDEHRGWMLTDGDGNKPSTNGTWLFIEEPIKVKSGLIFKAGTTLFRIRSE